MGSQVLTGRATRWDMDMVELRITATATLTYLHGDNLGSVSLTTNAAGQKLSEQRYKPYGEVRWSSGAGMPTDFTFTGQRAGPANYVGSLTDYVARFYSPALGRFVSADTIVPGAGNPAAFNRYTYASNTPLGRTDPDGHCDLPLQGGTLACKVADGFAALAVAIDSIKNEPPHRNGFAPLPTDPNVNAWTFERMLEVVNGDTYGQLRSDWQSGHPARALRGFVGQVAGTGQWDYKQEFNRAVDAKLLPDPDRTHRVSFGGRYVSFQAVANFTYGFFGAGIGIPLAVLVAGGGYAQKDPKSQGDVIQFTASGFPCNPFGCVIGFNVHLALKDDPFDSWWIRAGFAAYRAFGGDPSKLSEESLAKWLAGYEITDWPIPQPITW